MPLVATQIVVLCLEKALRSAPVYPAPAGLRRGDENRPTPAAGAKRRWTQWTVRWYCRVPEHPLWSVARIVKVKLLDEVGVPERTPPEVSVNPGGRLPLDTVKLYGLVPPLAVIVVL